MLQCHFKYPLVNLKTVQFIIEYPSVVELEVWTTISSNYCTNKRVTLSKLGWISLEFRETFQNYLNSFSRKKTVMNFLGNIKNFGPEWVKSPRLIVLFTCRGFPVNMSEYQTFKHRLVIDYKVCNIGDCLVWIKCVILDPIFKKCVVIYRWPHSHYYYYSFTLMKKLIIIKGCMCLESRISPFVNHIFCNYFSLFWKNYRRGGASRKCDIIFGFISYKLISPNLFPTHLNFLKTST